MRCGSTGIWFVVISCSRFSFYGPPQRFKGRVRLTRNHEEEFQGTADPIRQGRTEGVNGPCSRIPSLIKAPVLIIVLDRRIAAFYNRDTYLKSLKFCFIHFLCERDGWASKNLCASKCNKCKSNNYFSSLIEEERASRQESTSFATSFIDQKRGEGLLQVHSYPMVL